MSHLCPGPRLGGMKRPHLVIVGGGYGGVLAALRASRRLADRGSVTLISALPHLVDRIRLHQGVARGRNVAHPLDRILAGTGVTFRQGTVKGIDLERRRVVGSDLSVPYDKLIL